MKLILLLAAGATGLTALQAADAPDLAPLVTELKAFRERAEDEDSKSGLHLAATVDPLLAAVARIEVLVEGGQAEEAAEIAARLGQQNFPPEVARVAQSAATAAQAYAEAAAAEHRVGLREKIDELAERTAKTCMEAETGAALEAIMVELTVLDYPSRGRADAIGQRYAQKVAGISETALAWARYLDFKRAGKAEAANKVLAALSSSDNYPVLTADQIRSATLPIAADAPMHSAGEKILQGIGSLDDVNAAIEQLEDLRSTDTAVRLWKVELETLAGVRDYLQKGDTDAAYGLLRTGLNRNRTQSPSVPDLWDELMLEYLRESGAGGQGEGLEPGDDPRRFLMRSFEDAMGRLDHAAASEASQLLEAVGSARPGAGSNRNDITALSHFLAGQRLENAGDDLMALAEYRECLRVRGTELAPMAEAQEAVKRIGERNPQAIDDSSALVLDKLKSIEQRVEILNQRATFR